MTAVLVLATAALVGVLVSLERTDTVWRVPVKALASTGFLAIGFAAGALDSSYGRVILIGLALSWIGDLLLALPSRSAFLGGLVAFLLGHVAYIGAFVARGLSWMPAAAATGAVAVTAVLVWRWLRPHLDAAMVGPVAAYVVVISLMVVGAFSTVGFESDLRIAIGAVLFFCSDLFVARQRFVISAFVNRLVGLPLYYGAQILLASSVAGAV